MLLENRKHPLEHKGERRRWRRQPQQIRLLLLFWSSSPLSPLSLLKKGKVNPVHHEGKHKRESGATVQLILNLSSVWRWVVSCMPWKLYTPQKESPVLTAQETGWAPEPGSVFWRREKYLVLSSNQKKFLSCWASSLVFIILCYSSHGDDDDLPITLFNGSV